MTIFKQIPSMIAIVGLLFVTACDKERPYDEIKNKNAAGNVQPKSDVDHFSQKGKFIEDTKTKEKFSLSNIDELSTEKQYIAVVSNTSVDMDAPVTPYEMGREVRVVMSFTEDNLIAYEIPNQFNKTDLNFKPFIKIPIKHIDYRCALDANQKCTQKEIEDTEKAWVDKRYFVPSLEKVKVETLDGLFSSLINYALSCSKELESKVVAYKVEKDAVNITIEKTMRQEFMCAGIRAFINPASVTYRMQQNISLVKIDTLASPDYETMEYREIGPNEFGYFKTIYEKRDASNGICRDCHKEFVSRWNPKNKVIDYHLSTNFEKPENAGLKSATYHAIKTINESFKEAGTDMQIKLHDGTNDLIEGDIRKNLIVMVEDPIRRGLLGYGPSVTNPMTGEIIHARTVMFPGVMKRFVKRAYEEYLETIARQERDKIDNSGVLSAVGGPRARTAAEQAKVDRQVKAFGYDTAPLELQMDQIESHFVSKAILNTLDIITNPIESESDSTQVNLLERYFDIHGTETVELENELEELSRHNYYPAELFNTNEALGKQLKKIIVDNDYKKWDDLTVEVRANIVNNLLPITWIPTLIHEIGHNLGLRHNFNGSNDKDNYYTEAELAEKGIDRPMEYSSIMDYSYSSANELSIMGKYDVAALRFAYAEEVELKDGSMASIHDTIPEGSIRDFQYCSDEGVSLNASCNRFDQGTNHVEIVKNTMESYEQYYKQRNYKQDRYYFSSTGGDVGQVNRMRFMMQKLRTVFELYETIAVNNKAYFEQNPDAWDTDESLKDIKDATVLAGQFLIDIVKTPDVHCLIGEKKEGEIVPAAIMQLARLSSRDATCALAGEGLPEQFVVLGQAGKSFNHIKDQRNPSLYIEQIDVRGIWIDKMLALRTLTGRTSGLGNFDNINLNFLSVPELEQPIKDLLTSIVTDKHQGTLVFETTLGEPITIPWNYSLYKDGTHKLDRHFHAVIRMMFGLKHSAPTQFQDMAIKAIKARVPNLDDNDKELGLELEEMFNVLTYLPNGEDADDFLSYKIGNDTYYAYESNTMAVSVMKQISENEKAEALQARLKAPASMSQEQAAAYEAAVTAKVQDILEHRKANPKAAAKDDAETLEKLAYDIDVATLEASMAGQLLSVTNYHQMVLEALSRRPSRLDNFLRLIGF